MSGSGFEDDAIDEQMMADWKAQADPLMLIVQANQMAGNAVSLAEGGEQRQRAAAVFAQVAMANAIAAVAAAMMKRNDDDDGL